jgi:hypothetical protein
MRPPDFDTLIRDPAPARLVAVGLDITRSGRIEVALLVDREPFALILDRLDARALRDRLSELLATLPEPAEPEF